MRSEPSLSPADVEIVAALQAITDHGRPVALDAEALMEQGRRVHRRRTVRTSIAVGGVGAGLVAAAVGAVMVLTPNFQAASVGVAANPSASTPVMTSTTSTVAPKPDRGSVRSAVDQRLLSLFGPDFRSAQGTMPDGFGGVELIPGSPTESQLPAGFTASIGFEVHPRGQGSLSYFCAAGTEKETVLDPCVPVTTGEGVTLQKTHIHYTGTLGSGTTLRLIFQRPDGSVQLADIDLLHTGKQATSTQLTAANAWMDTKLAQLEQVAVHTPTPLAPVG